MRRQGATHSNAASRTAAPPPAAATFRADRPLLPQQFPQQFHTTLTFAFPSAAVKAHLVRFTQKYTLLRGARPGHHLPQAHTYKKHTTTRRKRRIAPSAAAAPTAASRSLCGSEITPPLSRRREKQTTRRSGPRGRLVHVTTSPPHRLLSLSLPPLVDPPQPLALCAATPGAGEGNLSGARRCHQALGAAEWCCCVPLSSCLCREFSCSCIAAMKNPRMLDR